MIDVKTSSLLDLFRKLVMDSGIYVHIPSIKDVKVLPSSNSDYSFVQKFFYDHLCLSWRSSGVDCGILFFADRDFDNITYHLRFSMFSTDALLFFKEWLVTDSQVVDFDIHFIEP